MIHICWVYVDEWGQQHHTPNLMATQHRATDPGAANLPPQLMPGSNSLRREEQDCVTQHAHEHQPQPTKSCLQSATRMCMITQPYPQLYKMGLSTLLPATLMHASALANVQQLTSCPNLNNHKNQPRCASC
jgi:hypothetical protein